MALRFYNVSDVPNKLNKTLNQVGSTVNIQPTGPNSETQATYLLNSPMPAGSNYVYDTATGKYYFIVEVTHDIAKGVTISCVLDPLQTYKSRLTGKFYFVRGADKANEMDDSSYPLGDYIKTETYNFKSWDENFFQNSAAGRHFMLRTAVGKPKTQSIIELSINDYVYNSDSQYRILHADDRFASAGYIGKTSGTPQILVGDLIRINGIVYRCDVIGESVGMTFYRSKG